MLHKKAVSNSTKWIVLGQSLILVSFFVFFFMFAPQLQYPLDGEILNKDEVRFEMKHANVILIDDNEDFSSPKQISSEDLEFSRVLFDSGTYYWKAVGLVESEQRKFTIPSTVGLELENDTLKNVGDVDLDVETKTASGITGLAIISVEVEQNIEDKGIISFKGGQHEE